jgi:ribosome biogenesis GTPase
MKNSIALPLDAGLASAEHISGEVVAAYGRQYLVECASGGLLACVPRGKKSLLACGDRVSVAPTGPGQGVIDEAAPRTTDFFRSAAHRTKLIAANATQVAVICATDPSFSDELVTRVLVAAEHQGLKALIILNKSDLIDRLEGARERLVPFEQAGYPVIVMSARQDTTPLAQALEGEVTVLVGQSGMGKSTLLNALVPEANRATREISTFLASGRHTTSHARLYRTVGSAIIDCPGLQEFGLAHLAWNDIEAGFPEFRPHLGMCRFQDCRHRSEPGCALHAAAANGRIHARRMELFHRIVTAERGNAASR